MTLKSILHRTPLGVPAKSVNLTLERSKRWLTESDFEIEIWTYCLQFKEEEIEMGIDNEAKKAP